MARLIDADALMNELMKVRWAYQMLDNTQRADIAMGGLRNAEKKVEESPTIDAVPVVRCKDCLFCQMELCEGADEPWCDIHHTTVDTEDFCSCGKEKQ